MAPNHTDFVEETTRVGVDVHKTIWKDFRRMVKNRKGKVNGFLSHEVNQALDIYMKISEGELLLSDPHTLDESCDYINTQCPQPLDYVSVFVERFGNTDIIHARQLKKFVVEVCGFTSRVKYYDIRDQLLASGLLYPEDNRKQIFSIRGDVADFDAQEQIKRVLEVGK